MSRKAFNFFKSYFDVANELNDADRLSFYDALISVQFTGEFKELKGMAKFAFISQEHSIKSQIEGFNSWLKKSDNQIDTIKIIPPAKGAAKGGLAQGKGEVQGKGQYVLQKLSFKDSEIYDKVKFAESFPNWDKNKLKFWYESAEDYSAQGNKYVDWKAAIRSWERKDAKLNIKPQIKGQPPRGLC
jgi:hypothetical protein